MANLLGSVLNPVVDLVGGVVGGVVNLVSNVVKAAGFLPNSDVTISFYDATTKALIKSIIVPADAGGRIEYTTSEFVNGETAVITGVNPKGYDVKITQVLKDYAPPNAPIASIDATGSKITGSTETPTLARVTDIKYTK